MTISGKDELGRLGRCAQLRVFFLLWLKMVGWMELLGKLWKGNINFHNHMNCINYP